MYYYEDLFSNCASSKQTWKNINSVLDKTKSKGQTVSLKVGGHVISESLVSERFNEFFASVGIDLARDIPETDRGDIDKFHSLTTNPLSIFLSQ